MKNADSLEAEGYDLIAKGHSRLAEARRVRVGATLASDDNVREWLPVAESPLGKRKTLALCRAGTLASSKIGRKVLVHRASLATFLARHQRGAENDHEDLFGEVAS